MTNTNDIRALSAEEIDSVSGGVIALGIAIFAASVALGYKVTTETIAPGTAVKDAANTIYSKIPPK